MSLRYSKKEITSKYDNYAKWYDYTEGIPNLLGLNRLRKTLCQKATGDVLEVAAGTGSNLSYYPRDSKITLVDLSLEMLKKASKKARKRKLNVSVQQMDVEELEFPDAIFDTVVDSLSLCTFTDPVKALEEMARVCKPNGRMLLLEHGRSNNERFGRWQDKRVDKHAKRVGCYWNRDILGLVKKANLDIISGTQHLFGIFHAIEALPHRP